MAFGFVEACRKVGEFVGGESGASAGASFGQWLRQAIAGDSLNDHESIAVLVAAFLHCVARADDELDEREEALILEICRDIAGESVDDERLEHLVNNAVGNDQLVEGVLSAAKENAELRQCLLTFGWRVAAKDMKITDDEVALMASAGQQMNASPEEFFFSMLPYCRQTADPELLAKAHDVLGVNRDAGPEEIKKRYHALSHKYHPDRFATHDEVVSEMAAEKFRTVTEAYELLMGGAATHNLVLAKDRTSVVPGEARGVCRCFFCGQKARLPDLEHLETARCAKCQALLAFDRETADLLMKGIRGEAGSETPQEGVSG